MQKNLYTIDWLYKTYKHFYDNYQITEENFKTVYEEDKGSVLDFAWYTFNLLLKKIAEAYQDQIITEGKFYQEQKEVYLEMAIFQRRYENKKGNHLWKQSLLSELMWNKIRHEQYSMNAIVICGPKDCCEYCNSLNEKSFPLDEAIKTQPIDCNKCTNDYGCRCCYGYSMQDD